MWEARKDISLEELRLALIEVGLQVSGRLDLDGVPKRAIRGLNYGTGASASAC